MTSRPHRLKKTRSMQSKRRDLHHTWLYREPNEKLSFYCYSPRWITTTFPMNNSFSWVSYSVYKGILRVYALVLSKAISRCIKRLLYQENLRYENDFFYDIECLCNNNTNTNFLTILIPNLFYINSVPLVNNFKWHCCRILRRYGLPNFSERRSYAHEAVFSLFRVFSEQS